MMQVLAYLALFFAALLLCVFLVALEPAKLENRLVTDFKSSNLTSELYLRIKSQFQLLIKPRKKLERVLFEIPDFLDVLIVALAAGESIFTSLHTIVPRMNGDLAKEFSKLLKAVDFGSGLEFELQQLSERIPQPQLVEVCNKLVLGLRRGSPLAQVLMEQAESVRIEIANVLTKRAGQNETRMLIPLIFLILPVTVLFSIYPSLQLLNINYL
jgi:tight adherence protein C